VDKYNLNSFEYILKKIFSLIGRDIEARKEIEILTKYLKILAEKDLDFTPYVFDKLFYITKFHKENINENSIKHIYYIFCRFYEINENIEDYTSEDKNNILTVEYQNKEIIEDEYYLKFLFYINFDTYYNMKFVLKFLMNNKEKLSGKVFENQLEHICNR